jgi:glycosyltransferase involved in cell wall biosynthesis
MRILHTEWSDDLGGQEKRVLAEAVGLTSRNHYVAIMCREHSKIKAEALKYGLDVYTLPMRNPYDILSILQLNKFLKEKKFDIVNTHSGVDAWIAGIASKLAGVPVLVRTRHLNIPLRRSVLNFIHYLPDKYITCGENMRYNLVHNCKFPADKVTSIPTGVDDIFFKVKKDSTKKLQYGLTMDSLIVSNVGIFRKVKGHDVTLKAAKIVADIFPNVHFLLVGDGPHKRVIEKLVDNLGLSEHVTFTGFVDNVTEIYSITDVAILSSWSEGVPQSVLQAMASGVPVVSTKVGGVPEIVMDGATGLLISPGDYDALAKNIISLLKNPQLALNLSDNAKQRVNMYSMSHMLDSIETLYRDMLHKKGIKSLKDRSSI